ncbi:hypothetical protein [Streptomyces sp. KN37]|uniref:hypothetical protein n=1 Tax=Streptomyces sp. KN37 TaxID=3090667 RepID=UPI002A7556ED|nr:hypothetical protein [Streptomyces sp. KN37]WPO70225.1 hypothetical protein R9806_06070 [Streptomyces sp. KN37]
MSRYSAEQRSQIAAEYDGYAEGLENVASELAAQGHDTAAEIQQGLADSYREIASASRESSAALNRSDY